MSFNLIEDDPLAANHVSLRAALDQLAAMELTVLSYAGLLYAYGLPPEQVPSADGFGGPTSIHTPTNDPIQIQETDSCAIDLTFPIETTVFVAPLQEDRASAIGNSLDWILLFIRAYFANQGLDGMVTRLLPVNSRIAGEIVYGGVAYTGFILLSHLTIGYDIRKAA